MEHSLIPNAHECAHLPPPTAADYARLDNALNTIFNKGTDPMTEQTTLATVTEETPITEEVLEQVGADTAVVATELLRQDGWAIVTAMQKALLSGVNQTSVVVLPVQGNLEYVLSQVSDPEGLKKILATLTYDISQLIEAVTILGEKHADRKGSVEDSELATLETISLGYSELQGFLERAIQPLVLQVADILEAAGIKELEIK